MTRLVLDVQSHKWRGGIVATVLMSRIIWTTMMITVRQAKPIISYYSKAVRVPQPVSTRPMISDATDMTGYKVPS
jgi:hypothetical protein